MKKQNPLYKQIALTLLLAICFNTFSFVFTKNAFAQALGEGPQQIPTWVQDSVWLVNGQTLSADSQTGEITIVNTDGTVSGSVLFNGDGTGRVLNNDGSSYEIGDSVTTGLTELFGQPSECSLGGEGRSELFQEILGPLAKASRAAAIISKLTGSQAFKDLGYHLGSAGQIINSAGVVIGDIGQIANGDLSGVINGVKGITELGSLLDKAGLIDAVGLGGLADSAISSLKNIFSSAAAKLSGMIDSAIGSVFGGSVTSVAGEAVGGVAGEAGAGVAGEAVGTVASVISVPVTDAGAIGAITASGALVSGSVSAGASKVSGSVSTAQKEINARQDSLNEIQKSLQYKAYVLDCTTWNASHRISEQIVADTLDFINKGNSGISWITEQDNNSFYLSDPIGFYNKLGNRVADDYLEELDGGSLDSSYKNSLINLLAEDQKTSTVSERLTRTISADKYAKFSSGDFMGGGGWETFIETVNNPVANDPYTGYLFARDARDERIATIANYYATQLEQGQGFLPQTDETGRITTPGQIIKEQTNEAIGVGLRSLENAQNFWQLVGNMGSLVTDIFRGFNLKDDKGNNLGRSSSRGLSNVQTPTIITPASTSTPIILNHPSVVATSTTATSTLLQIQTKLANIQSARTYAYNTYLPATVGVDNTTGHVYLMLRSFKQIQDEITALQTMTNAGTLPMRSTILKLGIDVDYFITVAMSGVSSPWYQNVSYNLNVIKGNVTEILDLL